MWESCVIAHVRPKEAMSLDVRSFTPKQCFPGFIRRGWSRCPECVPVVDQGSPLCVSKVWRFGARFGARFRAHFGRVLGRTLGCALGRALAVRDACWDALMRTLLGTPPKAMLGRGYWEITVRAGALGERKL